MKQRRLRGTLLWAMSAVILFSGTILFQFAKRRIGALYAEEGPKVSKPNRDDRRPLSDEESSEIASGIPNVQLGRPNAIQKDNPDRNAKADDNQDARFDRDAKELAKRLRTMKPGEQAKLRQQLESLNERHFEYRQQQRKGEIERLSDRVDSLRVLHLRRQANKAEVLKRRLSDLIDPNTDLDWAGGQTKDELPSKRPGTIEEDRLPVVVLDTVAPKKTQAREPTYKGVTLSVWLGLLETERDPQKLADAVVAMNHLAIDAEPRVLVGAILRLSRSYVPRAQDYADSTISHGIVSLLCIIRSDIVVEELLSEIEDRTSARSNKQFKLALTGLVGSLVRYPKGISWNDNLGVPSVSEESAESLRREIRRRSRRLVSVLAKLSQSDHALDDWVVESSQYILRLSEQPLTTYADLIPVVERVFADPISKQRAAAAGLLGESGLHVADVFAFAEAGLFVKTVDYKYDTFSVPVRIVAKLAPHSPLAVVRLIDELTTRWKNYESNPDASNQPAKMECVILIVALGEIGDQAKKAIPFLRSIEQSEASDSISNYSTAGYYGKKPTVRDHATDAIKQIEDAKPRPKPEPLPEDDDPTVAERSDTKSADSTSTKSANVNPTAEKTYDGVPYSQWLKMLETERKSEKLATAFDACSRLAEEQDERRIARGIFLAARLFETGDQNERDRVWQAGWTALNRLSADAVVDELIVALRDKGSYKSGREFQGRFLAENTSKLVAEVLKTRADVVVDELVKLITQARQGEDYLLAGASTVWRFSNRPLSDYERLQPLIIKMIDDGPTVTISGLSEAIPFRWKIVVASVIQNAPKMPDIALTLMKHATKSREVVKLIGSMRRQAEFASPLLVDLFLEELKMVESGRQDEDSIRRHFRLIQIIETLGEIGCGAKGHALLRQLSLIARPLRERDGEFEARLFESVGRGLGKFTPIPQSEPVPALLNDFSLINGQWDLRTEVARDTPAGSTTVVRNSYLSSFEERNSYLTSLDENGAFITGSAFQFEMDETKTPKQISLFKRGPVGKTSGTKLREWPGTRQQGIYELTETTLRIQLANVGEPRPIVMVTDKTKLPEGQLLLEFDRKLNGKSEKSSDIE